MTRREREVVRLVVRGLGNKQIAYRLGVSQHTVCWHLRNIYRKVGVHNRTQLAAMVWGEVGR